MKQLFLLFFISIFMVVQVEAQNKYPVSKKQNVVDDYFGTKVQDPYRWLEDDNAPDTKDWVIAENKVTDNYLAKIPFRNKIKERLEILWNYPKYSSPYKKGDWYYYYKNDGLQNQAVLYRTKNLLQAPEEFLDPNNLSAEGIVALGSLSFTKDGKLCAYSLSKAGSDWTEIFVMDVETKKLLTDKIEWTKFGGASWKGNEGFFYSGYEKADEKTKLSKANEFQKVYFHKLGTSQSEDLVVYENKEHPKRYYGCGLTEDERFLILSISEGTSGGEIRYKDLKDPNQNEFQLLVKGFDTDPEVVDNHGDRLLVKTNFQAPNYKVISIDPKKPFSGKLDNHNS